jgi:hypothetical protein
VAFVIESAGERAVSCLRATQILGGMLCAAWCIKRATRLSIGGGWEIIDGSSSKQMEKHSCTWLSCVALATKRQQLLVILAALPRNLGQVRPITTTARECC